MPLSWLAQFENLIFVPIMLHLSDACLYIACIDVCIMRAPESGGSRVQLFLHVGWIDEIVVSHETGVKIG